MKPNLQEVANKLFPYQSRIKSCFLKGQTTNGVLNLIVCFSYNGQLPLQNRGKYKTYFKLEQKSIANGVVPVEQFSLGSDEANTVSIKL